MFADSKETGFANAESRPVQGWEATLELGFELSHDKTVLASGWLVWKNQHISSGFAVAIAAGFALSHGYVHAAELQTGADAVGYASGFLVTTAVLHGLGVAVGLSGAVRLKIINSAFGLLCAVVGTTLLVGI